MESHPVMLLSSFSLDGKHLNLKGGLTQMLSRVSDAHKVKVYTLSEELKTIMRPLFQKHMDRIISGEFSADMMKDWNNNDFNLFDMACTNT